MISELPARGAPAAVPPPYDRDEGAEIRRWVGVLAHAWGVLGVGALAGGLLGFAAAAWTPSLYEAVATIMLVPPPSEGTGIFTTPGIKAIIQNPSIAADVVRELALDKGPYSFTPDTFRSRALTIEDVPNTYVTRVRVRLPDPELAARAANHAAERAIALTSRAWQDAIGGRRTALERQTEAARQSLVKAEQDWVAARLAPGGRGSSGLEVPRAVEEDGREAARTGGPTLDERLAASRKRGAALADARRRLPAAAALGDAYSAEFHLVRLENEVEIRRKVYMDLAGELEETRLEVSATPAPLHLIEAAVAPQHPLPSTRMRSVALGLLTGLVLAGCVVVWRESRASTR